MKCIQEPLEVEYGSPTKIGGGIVGWVPGSGGSGSGERGSGSKLRRHLPLGNFAVDMEKLEELKSYHDVTDKNGAKMVMPLVQLIFSSMISSLCIP